MKTEDTNQQSDNPTEGRDWDEDFSHENGNYQNRCIYCEEYFIGHKRRVQCKACAVKPIPHTVDTGKTAEQAAFRRNPYLNDLHRRGRSEFIAGAEWQASHTVDTGKTDVDLLKEYQSRLHEVYKKVGRLTEVDIDYCLMMTLHDNGFHLEEETR